MADGRAAGAPPAHASLPPVVDMATVVETARRRHPSAMAVQAALRAAEARAAQAGTWANPEVEFSYGSTRPRVPDLATDRPYGARVSQRLEWWGKRSARVAAAVAQVSATEAESATALLDLEIEVRLAGIALTSARAAAEQAGIETGLAQELAELVAKRQALGDIDHGEAARVRLEATTARLRQDAARRQVDLHLAVLRIWCGEELPDSFAIGDALPDPQTGEDGETPAATGSHPRIRAALEAQRAAEARVDAERHARMPDVTIGVYGEREYEKDTFGVSLGIEVPVWDRNSARIAEAEAERAQRAAQHALALRDWQRERTIAENECQASAAEVLALRDQAVPVAEELLALRITAFAGGDASVADVLEARRAALAVQTDLREARRRHAQARLRLLAATGGRP